MLAALGCHNRFQGRTRSPAANILDYAFELTWRRPESNLQSGDILRTLDQRFQIKQFELTTDL
jgi:hypothetical protein